MYKYHHHTMILYTRASVKYEHWSRATELLMNLNKKGEGINNVKINDIGEQLM